MNVAKSKRCDRCSKDEAMDRAGLFQGSTLCTQCVNELQRLVDEWQKQKVKKERLTGDDDSVNRLLREQFDAKEQDDLERYTRMKVVHRSQIPDSVDVE